MMMSETEKENGVSDIVERLREVPTIGHDAGCVIEAAGAIEYLRQRVKELEVALADCDKLETEWMHRVQETESELAALKSQQAAHMPVKTYCGGKPNYCKEQ